ncbi:hypothetical protein F3Y22_tig00111330pilonHSYRG01193 [Hibiscus syriacus]|uniref:RRM domain-containing protein n=1 Tax=Hibiscus syriacus TaxID=106335 RepID=A0A6A2YQ60_HIBSY|nr:hypothetical protein F3Y22_tig00111330pilonHSYRG01193 [Hibiscus syriacus]
MLGMVKPPQMTPTIQPPAPQQSQQSSQPPHQPNIQPSLSLPGQAGLQEQAAPSQNQPPLRKQQQNQVGMQTSVASVAAANLQSQPMPPYSLQTLQQTKGHLNPPLSLPHTSEPPLPLNSSSQLPHRHQTPMLTSSSQMQQSLQTTGVPHMPLHPPMQPQARLPLVPNFNHQYAPQMGPKVGFQHPCPPQHLSQLMFNSGNKPPSSHGPLFPQGQPPHANQMPPQSTYQNQMASQVRRSVGKSCVTVIIFNIPECLHHQVFWLLFDKYGEVVDSFIPIKRSKGGSRFSFVRFSRLEDARRAIFCADRSWIQGNKVRVFMVRFQPRDVFWKRKVTGSNSTMVKSREEDVKESPIIGVVDEDKLITLRDSLVGWCRKFIKMKELAAVMHKEGILGPKIMRLSGLAILIIFEDEESRDFALKNHIGALNKCFDKVELWSENFQCSSRRAWLSCRGIPPFVWSHSTFRNIAGKWGTLISIDAGTLYPGSFDRALFQIIMNLFVSDIEPCFSPDSVWKDSSVSETEVASPLPTEGDLDGVLPVKSSELAVCTGTFSRVNYDSTNIKKVQLENRASIDGTHIGGGMCGSGEVWAVKVVSPTVSNGVVAHGTDIHSKRFSETKKVDLVSGAAVQEHVYQSGGIFQALESVSGVHEEVLIQNKRGAEEDSRKRCEPARASEEYSFHSPMLDGHHKQKAVEERKAIFSSLRNFQVKFAAQTRKPC